MKNNGLLVTVAVLLIIYGVVNLGAGFAQFVKAGFIDDTASTAASFVTGVANTLKHSNEPNLANSASAAAEDIREYGQTKSIFAALVGVLILATAVFGFVSAIGIFTSASWTAKFLLLAGIGGIIVEIQDFLEDGFSVLGLVFLLVSCLAVYAASMVQELGGAERSNLISVNAVAKVHHVPV